MVFEACDRVLGLELTAGKSRGLKLVSRQFRKQRLAVWAAGRGPDPSFTAMVFAACDTVLAAWVRGPELCSHETQLQDEEVASNLEAGRAVQNGRQSRGLQLLSRHFRK